MEKITPNAVKEIYHIIYSFFISSAKSRLSIDFITEHKIRLFIKIDKPIAASAMSFSGIINNLAYIAHITHQTDCHQLHELT
jgi:hypothetical protein